jgi:hypothetical protein
MEHLSDDELNSRRLHHAANADRCARSELLPCDRRDATGRRNSERKAHEWSQAAQLYRRELARRRKEAG